MPIPNYLLVGISTPFDDQRRLLLEYSLRSLLIPVSITE